MLLLVPGITLAEESVLLIGLQSLDKPWTIVGPASIRLHKPDFTVECIELSADREAKIVVDTPQFGLIAGQTVQQAEFLAALLRGCGIYSNITRLSDDYALEVLIDQDQAPSIKKYGLPLISLGSYGRLRVQVGSRSEAVLSAAVRPTGSSVVINSNRYKGSTCFSHNQVEPTAVVTLDLDEYLQGVVPTEMPASWPLPALQAQAVAARTYALKHMGKHHLDGYDLCDTIHCQAFAGAGVEHERSNQAVQSTSGIVLTWGGSLIDAVYHSHAGGYTVSSQYAWGNQVPYLIAQQIPEEPAYIWSQQLTPDELEQLLCQRLQVDYIFGVQPEKYGEGRRVVAVNLDSLIGSGLVSVKDLRLAVGVNRIRSTCFTVTAYWADSNVLTQQPHARLLPWTHLFEYAGPGGCFAGLLPKAPTHFVFHGTGYGHGVGMSQWGAFGMANLGYSYKDILCRFYPGIELADYR